MPVFRDVDKVIVIPGGNEPDGCTQKFILLIGAIALAGFVLHGCPAERQQQQTDTKPASKHQPIIQPVPQQQFVPLRPNEFPNPSPLPTFQGRHPTNGDLTFTWSGRQWLVTDIKKPYRYLCVVNGGLKMCWPTPPHPAATPCTRNSDNLKGWCWTQ